MAKARRLLLLMVAEVFALSALAPHGAGADTSLQLESRAEYSPTVSGLQLTSAAGSPADPPPASAPAKSVPDDATLRSECGVLFGPVRQFDGHLGEEFLTVATTNEETLESAIDWGDGTSQVETIPPNTTMVTGHTYGQPGVYRIVVDETFTYASGEQCTVRQRTVGYASMGYTFTVELRAWIPQAEVFDPNYTPLRRLDGCLRDLNVGLTDDVVSRFRGDGHQGYGGTYKVRQRVSFFYNGSAIRSLVSLSEGDEYGLTQLDFRVRNFFSRRTTGTCTDTAQATSATYFRRDGAHGVVVGYSARNPLQAGAPTIDGEARISVLPGGRDLQVSYRTDRFPNHGIQMERNDGSRYQQILLNAGCLGGISTPDGIRIARRLAQFDNKGTLRTDFESVSEHLDGRPCD